MAQLSLDKDKIKILLLEGIHQNAVDNFKANGYTQVELLPTALNEEELCKAIKDVHFIGIRSRTKLTPTALAAAEKLMAIGCFCIGTNQVDLQTAAAKGIPVFNAPYSNTRSVAELVLAQAILLMRGIPEKNAAAHRGEWMKSAKDSYEIRGKKLGIVGYGSIGSQLSVLAESAGIDVYFYDIVPKLPLGNAKQVGSMEELLGMVDVVSLHVPETPETKNMMRAEQFAHMKDKSIFINAARGTVVDIDAMVAALESGKLLGGAVDVFPVEPKNNADEFVSPLRAFDNVILTPHIGGSTVEAQENIGNEVSDKFLRYSDNGSTLGAVNFPEVSLPSHSGRHRIMHIHKNVPGILSKINAVLSDNNVNIAGQYLMTKGDLGYVVIDVDKADNSLDVLEQLKDIEGTERCRVLF